MRLIELRLKNLNSLKGEWHIDFTDPAFINEGIFAITGQTGAGKTTILDAICLALYSRTPRLGDITGASNEMMTQGCGECSAEVVIEIDNKRYRCFWYQHRAHKKPKGKLAGIKHEVSDVDSGDILEDAKSKTALFIQELIGMDFNQFTRSIMLAQGSFAAFLKSDIGDRAAILEKITGTAIYAQISKNVFEKERDERHKLDQLQASNDSLTLLSADDEATIRTELKVNQDKQNNQRQNSDVINKQLHWLDKVAELRTQITNYQAAMDKATQDQQAFSDDAARLNAAQKVLEIDSPFNDLIHSRKKLEQLKTDETNYSSQLPEQTSLLKTIEAQLIQAQTHEQHTNNELQNNLPIFAKVRDIDSQIQQQRQSIQEDRQRQTLLSTDIAQLTQDITQHKHSAQDSHDEQVGIAKYLDKHTHLHDLAGDIATFNTHGARINTLLQDNAALFDKKSSYKHTAQQLQNYLDTLNEQQTEANQSLDKKKIAYQDLQRQQNKLIKNQSIHELRKQQEHIDTLSTQIEPVTFKVQQLNVHTRKLHADIINLPALENELITLKQTIDNNEADITAHKDKRQDKQNHLDALQKVASLESHIIELIAGNPCPLCGSLKHPYGAHHPFLDDSTDGKPSKIAQTRQQLSVIDKAIENASKDLSEHQVHYAGMQSQTQNTHERIIDVRQQALALIAEIMNQLDKIQDKNLSGDIARTLSQISTDTMDIKRNLNSDNADIADDQALSILERLRHISSAIKAIKSELYQQKTCIKATLTQYEDIAQKIYELNHVLNNEGKVQQQFIDKANTYLTEIKLNEQKLDNIDSALKTNFSELATVIYTVIALDDKYLTNTADAFSKDMLNSLMNSVESQTIIDQSQVDAQMGTLRQISSALRGLKQQHQEKIDKQQKITNELDSLDIKIDNKQMQLNKAKAEYQALTTLIDKKVVAVNTLQQDRQAKLGDKNPNDEEKRLRTALDEVKTSLAENQREHDNNKQKLTQLQAYLQQLTDKIQAAKTDLQSQEHAFAELLAASQFMSEAEFAGARLPKQTREQLLQQQSSIEQALGQARSQLNETQTALDTALTTPLTDKPRDTLAVKQSELQADMDTRSQDIGAALQQLRNNEVQKERHSAQNIAIDAQKQTLKVWQQLYKLIGSSDGKRYRTFAQGLTFEVMIGQANQQLKKMSDRYLLIHDNNAPLELNVIDNYQGGEVRSTKNLSGGEGFIISLALALGLSQMASQNIRVDSLFLDEGFGTLDEESLDIALSTLTGLQQEGKLIGVISHVPALKERILTQIQVTKLSGGFSQITGQGCQKITS